MTGSVRPSFDEVYQSCKFRFPEPPWTPLRSRIHLAGLSPAWTCTERGLGTAFEEASSDREVEVGLATRMVGRTGRQTGTGRHGRFSFLIRPLDGQRQELSGYGVIA